jgi:RNA polymerase sigma factor (sigma-70 family)
MARLREQAPRDEPAWFEMHERLKGYARAALSRAGPPDPEAVAELVNQVLARLHGSTDLLVQLARPEDNSDPRAYLVAVVYHAAVDFLRAQGRHSRRFVHLSNPEEVEASQPSPEEALRLRESDAELQEILSNLLEPAEWDLLRMRFWEDRSISEMAAIIKLPYHAVAMRLHRLQKKLVEVLKSRYFPEQ